MGGSWRRSQLRLLITAALGKPRDLSPASPTAGHLAISLPEQPPGPRAEQASGTSAAMGSCYSALSNKAVRVCAAIRPGIAATRLANTRAPTATRITDKTGTVGSGTGSIDR